MHAQIRTYKIPFEKYPLLFTELSSLSIHQSLSFTCIKIFDVPFSAEWFEHLFFCGFRSTRENINSGSEECVMLLIYFLSLFLDAFNLTIQPLFKCTYCHTYLHQINATSTLPSVRDFISKFYDTLDAA